MEFYVISHLSGSLEVLLSFQKRHNISPQKIILAGNMIGRAGAKKMLNYLKEYWHEYMAVLTGPVEKSFINWNFSSLQSPPMLPAEIFAEIESDDTWISNMQNYLSKLPFEYNIGSIYINANGKYNLGNNIFRPACQIDLPENIKIEPIENSSVLEPNIENRDHEILMNYSIEKNIGKKTIYLPDQRENFSGVKIIL